MFFFRRGPEILSEQLSTCLPLKIDSKNGRLVEKLIPYVPHAI